MALISVELYFLQFLFSDIIFVVIDYVLNHLKNYQFSIVIKKWEKWKINKLAIEDWQFTTSRRIS